MPQGMMSTRTIPITSEFISECSPLWSGVKVYDSLVTRG
jgi:hypothetical protein